MGNKHANKKPIRAYKDGVIIGTFDSKTETAEALGINIKSVYNALHGMKNRNGYEFELL